MELPTIRIGSHASEIGSWEMVDREPVPRLPAHVTRYTGYVEWHAPTAPARDALGERRPDPGLRAVDRRSELLGFERLGLRWGLIPPWAKDARIAYKMINARAETLLEKNSYRTLIGRRRCLIVADGFYEWRLGPDGRKQPIRFSRVDDEAVAFAGLWTTWTDPQSDELIESCTIITTTPIELVAPVHDRMSVILPPELEEPWLDPEVEVQEAISLLQLYPAVLMKALEASPLVNSVRNDFRDLLKADALAA
jgi:putative SOS response-associated peptidase YedK